MAGILSSGGDRSSESWAGEGCVCVLGFLCYGGLGIIYGSIGVFGS